MEKDTLSKWKSKNKSGQECLYQTKQTLKQSIARNKKRTLHNDQGSIQEDITTVNTYAHNIGPTKHIKQILTNIKGEVDSNTTIIADFNKIHFYQWTDFPDKRNKEIQILSDKQDQF